LQIRKSEGENGRKYINPEVVARRVQFLDSNPNSNGNNRSKQKNNSSANNAPADDDYQDVPF